MPDSICGNHSTGARMPFRFGFVAFLIAARRHVIHRGADLENILQEKSNHAARVALTPDARVIEYLSGLPTPGANNCRPAGLTFQMVCTLIL